MTPDLFTCELKRLEREIKALRNENDELRMAVANLLAAARGAWHVQARKAKANALKLIKRAA
ncbi:MAG: hypothetical protein IPL32_18800 [Chloracidobacterium sp.]|nr:hypothetical protein [Chloracidobacterium sp.]